MMMRRLAHVPLCQLFCANEKKGNHVSSSAADDKEEEEEEGKAKRRRTFCAALLVKCAQTSLRTRTTCTTHVLSLERVYALAHTRTTCGMAASFFNQALVYSSS